MESKEERRYKRLKVVLDKDAILPSRAHELDGGYDLYSRECVMIPAGGSYTFDTGVHMEIPKGYVGDVEPKSGLMVKYGIVTDGTVDAGYTGSIRVKLFNLGKDGVGIVKKQKIAQLVIKAILTPELEVVDRLEDTERGEGGFGSSGKF
jgi:dUTP pyrophosphatase